MIREVEYQNPFGITYVEECTRKELLESISYAVDDARSGYYWDDYSIWVEYDDGSYFSYIEGDMDGVFRKQHIKGIIVSNGSTYEVFGQYKMVDDNMLVELV